MERYRPQTQPEGNPSAGGIGTALACSVLVLATFVSLGGLALFSDDTALVCLFHDDAFYYFGVAKNVARGAGFTFDGLHRTNGFHPLWLFTVTPVFRIVVDDTAALRAILLLQLVFVTGGCIGVFRVLKRRIGSDAALAAALALVALPGSWSILASGLESSLLLLFFIAAWHHWLSIENGPSVAPAPHLWILLGLLCAAAFLARLEALLLVPIVLFLGRRWFRSQPRSALLFLAPPAIGAAAYFAWNRISFAAWLPISARVKAELAGSNPLMHRLAGLLDIPWIGQEILVRIAARRGIPPGSALIPALDFALILFLAAAAWRYRWFLRGWVDRSGIVFLLLSAAAWVASDTIAISHVEPWNRVPLHVATSALAGALLAASPRTARAFVVLMLLAASVRLLPARIVSGDEASSYAPYRYRAALWLRDNTEDGDRIGSWNAGLLGFFSHRSVVNLDGLVNDGAYLDTVVRGHRLPTYLEAEHILWLADQACGPSPRPTVYLARTGNEEMDPRWALRAAFFRAESDDGCPGYAVWRLDGIPSSAGN